MRRDGQLIMIRAVYVARAVAARGDDDERIRRLIAPTDGKRRNDALVMRRQRARRQKFGRAHDLRVLDKRRMLRERDEADRILLRYEQRI